MVEPYMNALEAQLNMASMLNMTRYQQAFTNIKRYFDGTMTGNPTNNTKDTINT